MDLVTLLNNVTHHTRVTIGGISPPLLLWLSEEEDTLVTRVVDSTKFEP